ncbi:MAG: ABC transporter permease [Candidatus Muproteobacteria bacterium RIFCSPHIGHO2_02_FULL_60_13]|uniref:ABC transporter permease n=1 Tax=Candidatus Muproteobacteria bacterium RIFCSPLOWO2_01_FULL_60_18 TaxID=1817768 RepID=A0A1F6TX34_9PROT|nr:MAG: ABC transporter permease [Candidatus Muproteobacteria bacterium RIFCSPLOWO2_01_FULL_60_18]OGI53363.1 MAG: ABC transporter permease [Candidatus Muproteobacteria bacterium RIFCSPHIGHO2_01_60_12]OGI54718.1 MAG: ABC transporter permease [Candidatus Muproteobacteria bacterium RIFCSPHIGHO2_02_FULL_60_13]
MSRRLLTMLILLAATPLTLWFALSQGSLNISAQELWLALRGYPDNTTAYLVIHELRLPRALSAFAVGGLLALSGALLQVLLRNPLADPYVLGVSGGAAVAALLSMLGGLGIGWVRGNAFLGALLSMLIVFGLSRLGSAWTQNRLLLTGVVVAAGWGALISLILALAPSAQVQGMLFWLIGDLSYATQPAMALMALVAGLAVSLWFARALNLLLRGEGTAAALGENPARLRYIIYLVASLLTAMAVTLAGSVGFVGLVIPHILRLVAGSDHRFLLPACVLLGGGFLTIADTLARSWVAPVQLPVGVITALLGVPAFLYLLIRSR